MSGDAPSVEIHRWGSLGAIALLGAVLFWAFRFEDTVTDHLASLGGPGVHDADGLAFVPLVRVTDDGRAELRIHYQNRYEGLVEAIVHLRPPAGAGLLGDGTRDLHVAFRADGGDVGVIRQEIAVPPALRGGAIELELAAAVHYPRSRGARLLRRAGAACGTVVVDWGGTVFRTGVHRAGAFELLDPVPITLELPDVDAPRRLAPDLSWRQERILRWRRAA